MRRLTAAFAAAPLLVAACGGGSSSGHQPLTVFAASSLQSAFPAVAAAFSRAHTGTRFTFSFAGSQVLAAQVTGGAPADVLATADSATVVAAHSPATLFARNRLEIAVRPGNPRRIRRLADLARPGLVVVLAAPSVPAGKYAAAALAKAHVRLHPASLEDNVRSVLTKVELGEADAAIVYVTDVSAAHTRVAGVPIANSHNAPAAYYVATVHGARHAAAAANFVRFLTGPTAQSILRRYGFLPP